MPSTEYPNAQALFTADHEANEADDVVNAQVVGEGTASEPEATLQSVAKSSIGEGSYGGA